MNSHKVKASPPIDELRAYLFHCLRYSHRLTWAHICLHGHMQSRTDCTDLHGPLWCARLCTAMHGYARTIMMCTDTDTDCTDCTAMHGNARICTDMHGYMQIMQVPPEKRMVFAQATVHSG